MIRTLAFALVAAVALSACNTMQGAGKDISSAGTAVTDTAKDTQKKM
ncbi:MAG: entericidin A/B family lipoprotein [Amaricoccus sp.]